MSFTYTFTYGTYSASFTSLRDFLGAVKSFNGVPTPAPAPPAPAPKCRREFALNLMKQKMALHGLRGWKANISDKMTRCYGCCNFKSKTISISARWLTEPKFTDDRLLNVILHEIAHALVGIKENHGPVWKAKALEIGAEPKSCMKL
jgi:hypothetical protein